MTRIRKAKQIKVTTKGKHISNSKKKITLNAKNKIKATGDKKGVSLDKLE